MAIKKKPVCSTSVEGYLERASALIREHGGRVTDTRLAVLSLLASTPRPLMPKDVLNALSTGKKKIKLDLVSVYRILQALEELDLVHQVQGGFFPCLHSGCKGEAHVLASCTNCEETEELHLPDEVGERLLGYLKREKHFTATSPTIQIDGLCRRCVK